VWVGVRACVRYETIRGVALREPGTENKMVARGEVDGE